MKRIFVAVSFAALASPAFAYDVSAPYEQTQFDRGLSNTQEQTGAASSGATADASVWANDFSFIAPPQ